MVCSLWCRWMKIAITLHLNPSRNVKLWDWDIWSSARKVCVQSRNETNYATKAQRSEEHVWQFTVKAVFSSAISCWLLQMVVLQQITVGVNERIMSLFTCSFAWKIFWNMFLHMLKIHAWLAYLDLGHTNAVLTYYLRCLNSNGVHELINCTFSALRVG